jgi:hypothetical protein
MGGNPRSTITENYNGSSWSEVSDMATARDENTGRAGTGTTALMAGGNGNPGGTNLATTEEWTFSGIDPSTTPAAGYADAITGDFYYNSTTGQFKTVNTGGAPIGTWAAGGSVNTGRRYTAGLGSTTAGLMFGGTTPGAQQATTESYDGTSWAEVSDLNTARIAMGSAGTLTSGMSALGTPTPQATVEDWNGSVWAVNPHSLNSARQFPGGDGPSNDSALMVGGEPSPNGDKTEIYNGSSWTEVAELNTARNQLAAAGTTTALIAIGGNTGNDSELWNGSTWTATTDMNSGAPGIGGSGSSTAALAFGGNSPASANNEAWDGTSWTEVNDLSTGRRFFASSNIVTGNTSAYAVSGLQNPPANLTSMEIFTAADFLIKSVTTS